MYNDFELPLVFSDLVLEIESGISKIKNWLFSQFKILNFVYIFLQSHGSLSGGSEDGTQNLDYDNHAEDEYRVRITFIKFLKLPFTSGSL